MHRIQGVCEITAISGHYLPKPVMEALEAHLQGLDSGYIFEGRDQGHISNRQIRGGWMKPQRKLGSKRRGPASAAAKEDHAVFAEA